MIPLYSNNALTYNVKEEKRFTYTLIGIPMISKINFTLPKDFDALKLELNIIICSGMELTFA